ncbi:PHD finger protein ALFIN-like 3 [Forsythia ovata]|uniref:PHD finger protein ALFIN-LIKE n=1 Tax=Forsythia ovata TaxID=205694 RepID=A0ABD1X9H4_9LAMI
MDDLSAEETVPVRLSRAQKDKKKVDERSNISDLPAKDLNIGQHTSDINDLPTIVEVVTGAEAARETSSRQPKRVNTSATGASLCGACGNNYGTEVFWICCDVCGRWFHGTCVNITRAEAEHIEKYKCLTCSNERARV